MRKHPADQPVYDETRQARHQSPGLPHVGGTMAAPADVLADTETVFDPAHFDPAHALPLVVEVRGVVHTVPNPAQRTVPYQTTVNSTLPVKIANGSPARRAQYITNRGTNAAHVVINTHAPADMTDGALIQAGGGSVTIDDKSDWWALAAADGQKLSILATFEDG